MTSCNALAVPEQTGIARRIYLARIAAGLEPDEVARAIGVSLSTYQKTEAGARPPRRGELIAIAHVTGQDLAFFGASLEEERAAILPRPLPLVNPEEEEEA